MKFLDSMGEGNSSRYEINGLVSIERGKEFLSAFAQIGKQNLRQRFQFEFIDRYGVKEPGVDMGGPTKEFLSRACGQVFSPTYGMFIETPTKEVIPNPQTMFSLPHYEFAGQLVAKAMYEKVSL